MPSCHLRLLLTALNDATRDLIDAKSLDHAAAINEEIHAIRHSLWLAGWKAEAAA